MISNSPVGRGAWCAWLAALVLLQPVRSAAAQELRGEATRTAVEAARRIAERFPPGVAAERALASQVDGTEHRRLATATLRRLRYDRAGAARSFRALRDSSSAPTVRLYAGLGLAELSASTFAPDARTLALTVIHDAQAQHDLFAEADAWRLLARVESRVGALDSALAYFRRSVALAPADAFDQRAAAFCAHGQALRFRDGAGATALVDAGLVAAHRAIQRRHIGTCLLARAQIASAEGDAPRSLLVTDSAISAFRSARDVEAEAGAWQLKAYLLSDALAQPGRARTAALEARRLARASGNVLAGGWAELVLAQVAMRLAQPSRSWTHAVAAEQLLRPLGDQFGLATVAFVRAEAAHADVRLAEADSLYAVQERWAADGPQRVVPRLRRAATARQSGRLAAADSLLALVREDVRRWNMAGYGTDRLYELGLLRAAEGKWATADSLFAQFASRTTRYPDLRFAAASRRATAAASLGRFDEALVHLDSAARFLDRQRTRLADRTERAAVFRGQRIDFDAAFGLPLLVERFAKAGRFDAALRAAELHRARALTDRAVERLAGTTDGALMLRTGPVADRDARLRLTTLVQQLPDDLLVLEYVLGGAFEPSTLIAVSHRGVVALPLALPSDLAVQVDRFTTALAADLPATRLGTSLARDVLGPALPLLGATAIRRVAIVPDGVLHRLPFDALVLPSGRRLFERAEVTLLPSAQLLLRAPAARPMPGQPRVVAFGDPAFSSSIRLPRLPATRDEVRRAASIDRHAVLQLGDSASETALRTRPLRAARVLHLATHAVVANAGDDETALHLAPGPGHDGRLAPDEIASLDLDTDLVVLSACRTAGGTVLPAEGLQGLVAPFLEAGSRNVLATHWDVRDREMVPLMARVYDGLGRGATVSAAVRAARLAALREGQGPRQWAVLMLTGDGSAVPFPAGAERRVTPAAARGAWPRGASGRPAGAR